MLSITTIGLSHPFVFSIGVNTMRFNRTMLIAVAVLASTAGLGAAIWASGISISGLVAFPSGSQPAVQVFSYNLSSEVRNVTFVNPDGAAVMQFACGFEYSSADSRCTASALDAWIEILSPTQGWVACSSMPSFNLTSGNNTLSYRVAHHENNCPLTGTYTLVGTIS